MCIRDSHSYLRPVTRSDPGHPVTACKHLPPIIYIFGSVGEYLTLARGPRRGVYTDEILGRNADQGKRVALTQIIGFGKGKTAKIFQRPDIIRGHSYPVKTATVECGSLVGVPHCPSQTLQLKVT